MTTARDIIYSAARKIHVLGRGQNMPADAAQEWLRALNGMLASWSAEGDTIYTETRESFPLTSGKVDYTIGTGADFNTVRPIDITSAFVRYSGTDYGLTLQGSDEYANTSDKDIQGIPGYLYYDADYPAGNIFIYPAPYASMELHLYSRKPLTGFTSLDAVFALPPEYERGLIFNLAVERAPDYEKEAADTVKRIAMESKGVIQTQNTRNDKYTMTADPMLMGRGFYNIYSGTSS